jgi:hypothetical protein
MPNETVTVIQADMDAAAALLDRLGSNQRFEKFGISFAAMNNAFCGAFAAHRIAHSGEVEQATLNDIATMMSEFVDNWPTPKKVSTALALIAKTIRAALDPPKHKYWGAGEPDCPREIKAGNGELHTLRCKVCGKDSPRDYRCFPTPPAQEPEHG